MADYMETGKAVFSGVFSKFGQNSWLLIIIGVLVVIFALVYIASQFKKKNQTWNLRLRIRQEDTRTEQIYLDPVGIKARRITLSNGMKMMLLEKPILGKRLMPLLNYYTKPGVYDIILTADNRIFLTTGIEGIDKQRKLLKVGVRYPGIDQDLDDLNRDYGKLNQQDKTNNLLDIIKAASIGILAIVILIAIIMGGKYWLDGKEMDVQKAQAEAAVFEQLAQATQNNVDFGNAMSLWIPKLEEAYGTKNLNNQLNVVNQV